MNNLFIVLIFWVQIVYCYDVTIAGEGLQDFRVPSFTSPRRQRRRQTRQRLFTLPKSPVDDVVLSINGNVGNAGDTGFAG